MLRSLSVGGLADSWGGLKKEGLAEPSWVPGLGADLGTGLSASLLSRPFPLHWASPLPTPTYSQQPSLLPTPFPPGPWIMSTGLENRMLVCFLSLVPAHQHPLPVAKEGAALASLVPSPPWPD